MATQTGSIDLKATGGFKTYAEAQFATSEQATTLNTAIEQNARDILLRATKEEAAQMAQPNLSPFFSVDRSDDSYWHTLGQAGTTPTLSWSNAEGLHSYSDAEGEWAHVTLDARTSAGNNGSSTNYFNIWLQKDALKVEEGKGYTWVVEIRNATITGKALHVRPSAGNATLDKLSDVGTGKAISDDGVVYATVTAKSDFSSLTRDTRGYFYIETGGYADFDVRMALFEGEYEGPYKPYVGSQLYASQAELKVANDAIDLKVSKNDVINQINLSTEGVTIDADKVNITGATIFTSGRLSESSLNAAYDAKGAAATVQDNLDNLEVGGRNLARNTADFSGWGRDNTVWTFSDGVATFTPPSTRSWKQLGQIPGMPLSLFDFDATYVISFDAMLVSGTVASGDSLSPCVSLRDTANTNSRQRYRSWNIISSLTSEWQRITKVIDPLPISSWAGTASSEAYFGVDFWLYTATATIAIRNAKLEKGNKATDWSPAPEDTTAEALASGIEYIEGTQTAATNLWTGVTKETALVAGKSIAYKLTYAGTSTAATLNLTLAGGGTTGAKAVKMVYSTSSNTGTLSNVTTHWPVNSIIQMTYDGTQWVISNYNTNVDDKNARNVRFYNTIVAGEALAAASIIGMHADGKFYQVKEYASFLLSAPLLWLTAAKAAAATNADAIYTHAYDVSLATYYTSFVNTTKNCTVYLVGTVNGNTFSTYGSSSAQYLTVTEPTTEDGRFYIPLGRLGNASTGKNYFNYVVDYPVSLYAYLDGRFRQVTPTEIVASHRVYYRTGTATSSLAAPTSWVTEATGNVYDAWTTKVPPLAASTESGQQKYLFLYTCEQRRRLDGTIQCTGVQLDENTTVIDGGNIITGSVTANQIAAGTITGEQIAGDTIEGGNIKGNAITAEHLSSAFSLDLGKVDGLNERLESIEGGISRLQDNTQWVHYDQTAGTVFGESGSANNVTVKGSGIDFNTDEGRAAWATGGVFHANEMEAETIDTQTITMGDWAIVQSGSSFSIDYIGS